MRRPPFRGTEKGRSATRVGPCIVSFVRGLDLRDALVEMVLADQAVERAAADAGEEKSAMLELDNP